RGAYHARGRVAQPVRRPPQAGDGTAGRVGPVDARGHQGSRERAEAAAQERWIAMMSWMPPALTNHLWQSTIGVAVVWLATLALRRNGARVRCWLWMAASAKFLLPLSVLVAFGRWFEWRAAPPVVQPAVSFVMQDVLTPADVIVALRSSSSVPASASILPLVLLAIWVTGAALVLWSWWRQWLPVR